MLRDIHLEVQEFRGIQDPDAFAPDEPLTEEEIEADYNRYIDWMAELAAARAAAEAA